MGDSQRSTHAVASEAPAPGLHIAAAPHRPGNYERYVKPLIDRFAGIALSVVTAPVVCLLAMLIRSRIGKPAIFRQRRVGRNGVPFTVYKLRTMRSDRRNEEQPIDHPDRRVTHKSDDDPRHTGLGRALRKFSLDEIPQFWNLARGEMSVVGPRPELVEVVARYEPWQHRRHEVRPGLTGLWQITARGEIPMHEATELDVEYVDNVTFLGDLAIVLRTPTAILGARRGR